MKAVLALTIASCLLLLTKGETVTYDGLGTFSDQVPWGGTDERPSNILPSTPESVGTRFYLDTRRKKDVEIYNTDMTNLKATNFDANKMTRIIIHGYVQNGDTTWLGQMSEAHLAKEDVNSIRIGWMGSSLQINYFQSAIDSQIVGAELGLFIKNVVNTLGGDVKKFHCIGHSLGAHSCSYASNYLERNGLGKISRITGLDPAGPYFQDTSDEVRLEASDADFVDAIHTDAEKLINMGMGIAQTSGHVDFWPNDGIDQPGCDQNALTTIWDPDGVWEGASNFVACNHMRSYKYYTESVLTSRPFVAYPCNSYADYLAGKCDRCDGDCIEMGYHADQWAAYAAQSWSTDYYLNTNWQAPFCEYMTDVQVHTSAGSDDVEGRLFVALYGSVAGDNTELAQLSDDDVSLNLMPSHAYSYLTHFHTFPADISSVKVLWYQDEWAVTKRRLTVDQVTIYAGHMQQSLTFCGDGSVEMESERRYQFDLC